jgi:hypothetical protein
VWLDLNLLLVRTSGVPQVGAPLTFTTAPLRSIAALGVQLGWQAATFAARSGLQISNPTCQVALVSDSAARACKVEIDRRSARPRRSRALFHAALRASARPGHNATMSAAMQYRVLTVQTQGPIGTDFTAASQQLAELVNKALAEGWEPVGGVEVGHPLGGAQPTLLQALIKRRV